MAVRTMYKHVQSTRAAGPRALQPHFGLRHRRLSTKPLPIPSRSASSELGKADYTATLPNLRIGSHTRVIFQGFTGRQATADARDSLAWGTNIVGGVTPGRTGEHLGLPVLPSVRQAVETLRPHATAIYVAAQHAANAIEEAIEAEVPLIVAVAEHVPVHQVLRIHSVLKTQSKSRLIGPNSPGITSAVGRCRIGFQPFSCFSPGRVGILAKSGTLSYEAVASTTRAGLGQSLCIGIGGDMLPGTDLREGLSILELDEDTDAIVLIGEIGGTGELDAAAWIADYHVRTKTPKPIVALVAGINAVSDRAMGHAGAFIGPGEPDARAKMAALEAAGATIVNHPAKFGDVLKKRLESLGPGHQQRRHVHRSSIQWPLQPRLNSSGRASASQSRALCISEGASMDLLRANSGTNCGTYSGHGTRRFLGLSIDRNTRSPCVLASPTLDLSQGAHRFPFDYRSGLPVLTVKRVAEQLRLAEKPHCIASLRKVLAGLSQVFYHHQAYLLQTHLVERLGEIKVVGARFFLDDAARHGHDSDNEAAHPQALVNDVDPCEVEAAAAGMVYIRFDHPEGRIGTLVNGAGLAMNTIDRLVDLGGRVTNFLDTGGKATSETVRTGLAIVLRDPRVRVVLVNIFGGLTLGDMVARGVLLALQELKVPLPVVVRIRGTNEREGQQLILNCGLSNLYAYDDFEEAAGKAVELARL